jgi:hypothetical protein
LLLQRPAGSVLGLAQSVLVLLVLRVLLLLLWEKLVLVVLSFGEQ